MGRHILCLYQSVGDVSLFEYDTNDARAGQMKRDSLGGFEGMDVSVAQFSIPGFRMPLLQRLRVGVCCLRSHANRYGHLPLPPFSSVHTARAHAHAHARGTTLFPSQISSPAGGGGSKPAKQSSLTGFGDEVLEEDGAGAPPPHMVRPRLIDPSPSS